MILQSLLFKGPFASIEMKPMGRGVEAVPSVKGCNQRVGTAGFLIQRHHSM